MRRFVMAVTLACVVSVATFAGEIPSTDQPVPPPPIPVLPIILQIINAVVK